MISLAVAVQSHGAGGGKGGEMNCSDIEWLHMLQELQSQFAKRFVIQVPAPNNQSNTTRQIQETTLQKAPSSSSVHHLRGFFVSTLFLIIYFKITHRRRSAVDKKTKHAL